jgi:hypothetical protein
MFWRCFLIVLWLPMCLVCASNSPNPAQLQQEAVHTDDRHVYLLNHRRAVLLCSDAKGARRFDLSLQPSSSTDLGPLKDIYPASLGALLSSTVGGFAIVLIFSFLSENELFSSCNISSNFGLVVKDYLESELYRFNPAIYRRLSSDAERLAFVTHNLESFCHYFPGMRCIGVNPEPSDLTGLMTLMRFLESKCIPESSNIALIATSLRYDCEFTHGRANSSSFRVVMLGLLRSFLEHGCLYAFIAAYKVSSSLGAFEDSLRNLLSRTFHNDLRIITWLGFHIRATLRDRLLEDALRGRRLSDFEALLASVPQNGRSDGSIYGFLCTAIRHDMPPSHVLLSRPELARIDLLSAFDVAFNYYRTDWLVVLLRSFPSARFANPGLCTALQRIYLLCKDGSDDWRFDPDLFEAEFGTQPLLPYVLAHIGSLEPSILHIFKKLIMRPGYERSRQLVGNSSIGNGNFYEYKLALYDAELMCERES